MKYFITGVPGTGKTTIGKLLQEKGHFFVDVDYEPGLSSWYDQDGNKVSNKPDADADWYSKHDWYWDKKSLENLLSKHTDKHIFVCGMTSNQTDSLELFDKTFYLKVSNDELLRRREGRSKTDTPNDCHDFHWHERFERSNLDKGAILVDAEQTTEEIITDVLNQVGSK